MACWRACWRGEHHGELAGGRQHGGLVCWPTWWACWPTGGANIADGRVNMACRRVCWPTGGANIMANIMAGWRSCWPTGGASIMAGWRSCWLANMAGRHGLLAGMLAIMATSWRAGVNMAGCRTGQHGGRAGQLVLANMADGRVNMACWRACWPTGGANIMAGKMAGRTSWRGEHHTIFR